MDQAEAIAAVLARHEETALAQGQARRAVEERSASLRAAHAAGVTWGELGRALGVSGARALAMSRPADQRSASRARSKSPS